jgi:hypothetical protein
LVTSTAKFLSLDTSMYQQLKVFGIVPRGLPTGNIHGIDSQVHFIPGTRHCEDLHHHLRSNLLFGACEGPASPRWKWNPPAAHYDDPQDVPTGEGRGGLIVVDPKVRTLAHSKLISPICRHSHQPTSSSKDSKALS